MKIYLSILYFLLFSCSNSKEKRPKNILSETIFQTILKEIHLTEAAFELNKNNGIENAKNELTNAYFEIYKKNQISEKEFKTALIYYTENPEKLERTYNNILEVLSLDRSKIDQQETN